MPSAPDPSPFLRSSGGRPFEWLVGLVCAAIGLALVAFGAFALSVELEHPRTLEASSLVVVATICALAAMFLTFGFRLLTNRTRRSDGGLMSPLGLRLGGVLFLLAPLAALPKHPLALLETSSMLAASAACFALARHRESHLARFHPPDPMD